VPVLDLKQIENKLNSEFTIEIRKIIFWYDEDKEFVNDIDSLSLVSAKLHKLTGDNQFATKLLLEKQDIKSSYLIYAPFEKPPVRDNALEDIYLYSQPFFADRASLIIVDLKMDERFKPVIQKHIKFFSAQDRVKRLYDYDTESFTSKESIEIALMSALCRTRTASFEEVLRVVLTEGGIEENTYISEFNKYDLLTSFWQICEDVLGYTDNTPSPMRLAMTLFITYTSKQLLGDVPQAWKSFISYKSGSIITFMDSLMNSILYRPKFDDLSGFISNSLNVRDAYKDYTIDSILHCDAFPAFDELITGWIAERLLNEDTGAKCDNLDIPAICNMRSKMHFGELFSGKYSMLSSAYEIVKKSKYASQDKFDEIVKQYIDTDYKIDECYRRFYVKYDKFPDFDVYEKLRSLVENIYTNVYLGRLLPAWNNSLEINRIMKNEYSQLRFYDRNIKHAKDKTVVIISDALRYDVGQELFTKLSSDANCNVKLSYLFGVLPGYTSLGWAALLPHKALEIKPDGKVLVDGQSSDTTEKREVILQNENANTRCVSFERLPTKRDDLREIFTGMDAVYIRHNRIDARGSSSEDEVLQACSEAVDEIYALIKRLSGSANVYRFIVTADHGFLYKRERFTESEKINLDGLKSIYANRRFIIADDPITTDGVASVPITDIIGGDDKRFVSYPISANVFKTPGSLGYVHGGSSPQEMILPVISIKTEKGHVDTYPAKIALVSMIRKVTNLITQLDFIQKDPVNDVIKPAEYKLYFISEDNEKISNEQIYQADKKDTDSNKRIFRLRFDFKNKKYDSTKQYWLVAVETKSGMEIFRHQVIIDIAFADDFGF